MTDFQPYPRDERNRYRVVVLDPVGVRTLCTTDSREGVGVALCTLAEEGELEGKQVGVLDVHAETGRKWIVNPWVKG